MSQKTNSMLKLALVFFISLLSFSIGTYVGKKYSDNQYKLSQLEPNKKGAHEGSTTEFAATETEEHGESHATAANEHGEKHEAGGESQKLTDSEVAKIAEEFASESNNSQDEKPIQTVEADEKPIKTIVNEKATAHHAAAATPAPAHAPTQAAVTSVKPMPAKTTVATVKMATSHEREPSSIPPSKEGTSVGAHYTVQIGSFPSEADAQKMTKEMLAKGIKTSYINAQVKGQTYYRVNVGLFGTAKEADEYKKDFLEKTKLTSAFVQKVQ